MKDKTIYQLASLVMILVMILGNTIHTQAAAPVAQTAGPSIYWGAMVNGNVPSTTNLQGVFNTFETRSKKKMSIIHWGQPWMMKDGSWGEFQTTYFQNARSHGSIPMLNWSSQRLGSGINQADFQLRDIYAGTYDTYIRRWATAAKNWGHPFFLRFDHEMNGWWYPWGEGKTSSGAIINGNSAGDFVKAWQHVHNIFTSVGATNVSWVWSVNHVGNSSQYPALSTLYPGDDYVDWTGISVYNKYNTWAGINPLLTGSEGMTWYKNTYNMLLTVAPSKPIILTEFASLEAGDGGAKKAAWITNALTAQIPVNFPKIKAVVWMNWDIDVGKTYPIESSQAATDAWAAAITSPVYAANQYANLNTSPIPALAASQSILATPTTAPTVTSATPTAQPAGTSATFTPIADTFIDGASPNWTGGGASTTLYVNGSPIRKAFLKFDLTPLGGKSIASVKLRFKTTSDSSAGSIESANVKLVNSVKWKEQFMSYSNTVAISSTVLGTVPANTAPNTWYEVTLTVPPIQQKLGGLLSVAFEKTGSDGLLFYSREAADRPQLIITYK